LAFLSLGSSTILKLFAQGLLKGKCKAPNFRIWPTSSIDAAIPLRKAIGYAKHNSSRAQH
jgi:hypothetical protein